MQIGGMALAVLGYALFYSGASNLFTGGSGWGFLQSLLNKGEANTQNSFGSLFGSGSDNSYIVGTIPESQLGTAEGNGIKGS